jgi:uncharacterized protein
MRDAPTRISDEELLRLAEFLDSEDAGEEALDISQLDGFLTALAVGPVAVPEAEWWPQIWGEKPHFPDPALREQLENIVRQRFREVAASLAQDPQEWTPIFYETEEGEVLADAWCGGFVLGMEMRRDAWLPLFTDEESFVLVLPVLLVASEGELGAELDIDPEEVQNVLDQAPELVPGCVAGIREFFARRAAGEDGQVNGYGR